MPHLSKPCLRPAMRSNFAFWSSACWVLDWADGEAAATNVEEAHLFLFEILALKAAAALWACKDAGNWAELSPLACPDMAGEESLIPQASFPRTSIFSVSQQVDMSGRQDIHGMCLLLKRGSVGGKRSFPGWPHSDGIGGGGRCLQVLLLQHQELTQVQSLGTKCPGTHYTAPN